MLSSDVLFLGEVWESLGVLFDGPERGLRAAAGDMRPGETGVEKERAMQRRKKREASGLIIDR